MALFVFAGAALCAAAEDVAGWWLPVSSFLAAAALWKTGMDDHEMLARYRRDRFSSPDDSVYKGDQLVRQAISSWCQREQLEPLRVLLAGWPPKTWNREEMTTLIRLLEQIEGMPDTIVRHEEREKLAKAVAQFRTTI